MDIIAKAALRVAVVTMFAASMASSVQAAETSSAYSKFEGRDCAGSSICHIEFSRVADGFRLEIETVSCITTTDRESNGVNYAALYVAGGKIPVTKAIYGVSPHLIGNNGTTWFWSFNQQGFMPVFAGQTPRVETYRPGGGGEFTNNCTISGHLIKIT